ncbi:hypothetical protein R69658_07262 [Paraburkholderia aspalathi]|uniref:Uncharacterized protein n=1 Tax=Paraburkholderia aspalathi TaxID=1324617 RepID=A0ABM8T2L1_9BURK|nr:hypothetical protein R69658_07262 [Paraburkholderia aspalathi]
MTNHWMGGPIEYRNQLTFIGDATWPWSLPVQQTARQRALSTDSSNNIIIR